VAVTGRREVVPATTARKPAAAGQGGEGEQDGLVDVTGTAARVPGGGIGIEAGGADLAPRPDRRAAHATASDVSSGPGANTRARRSA
jgi:hypothetical protein